MQKPIKSVLLAIVFLTMLVSGCAPAPTSVPPTSTSTATLAPTLTSSPTITLTPTLTPSPTITLTPTPFIATFNDDLCGAQGSFVLEGEFWPLSSGMVFESEIEGFPSYMSTFRGKSINGAFDEVDIFVWVKHNASPGPNEFATLPDGYSSDDIKFYTSENFVVFNTFPRPARLKLHVIAPVIPLTPGPKGLSPLKKCEYVLEEIQLR